ncbi:MAG: DUF4832 domain-containing protein [Sedimentisphaerales bacterium]|jgi:hypothetical protein|nr:DUF4832 domain-containing protein [Sedimentisphaerales bacterium]HNY78914.1 DUF4832 domain-containing protein [Sedimentisphaerales bacterium]HOC62670.1 DUF4832 domain-containing protein [Sedimentisphaerales bacterium]HOH64868.1 DUF4832 domain-containing protein [Sedimentisphaerales bacterium]HPY48566.1 DUF4832 domain-containing protein [Sedimentisphaerales bacterium]
MNRYETILVAAVCFTLVLGAWGQQAAAGVDVVRVVPEETDELLANPGMGWQTFHHTRDQDRNLPGWIPSTVHYARWGWGQIEPRPGEIDHAFLDRVLEQTRAAGQRLAFRVMCCSTSPGRPYHPDWLDDVGGRIIVADHGNQKELPIPDLDDPEVLARHLDFIGRLGARYDGHPDIDHVDLGTVGWWGEWHMSSSTIARMPTVENRRQIIDAYAKAFTKTPLVMLIGDSESLAYAAERGAGWRADCLGDMGGFSKTWCHMCDAYPQLVRKAGVADAWKTAPVAWETCWDMRRWVSEGWSLRYIFNYALAMHGSHINNKSAPLPAGENVRQEIERFLRRLGYRLVLRELSHPKQARPGDSVTLAMKWQNTGSAPCYRPYRLAYRLLDEQGRSRVLIGNVTVEKWMPGTVDIFDEGFLEEPPDLPPGEIVNVSDRVTLPPDLYAGEYSLAIAIVGERSTDPIVRLAIKGGDQDGWYLLSEIVVRQ